MDSGNARSHRDGGGLPVFHRKTGFSEYLLRKYSDSPRPSATPLINAGGNKRTFFDSLKKHIPTDVLLFGAASQI